jgi:hypothetical protein
MREEERRREKKREEESRREKKREEARRREKKREEERRREKRRRCGVVPVAPRGGQLRRTLRARAPRPSLAEKTRN